MYSVNLLKNYSMLDTNLGTGDISPGNINAYIFVVWNS